MDSSTDRPPVFEEFNLLQSMQSPYVAQGTYPYGFNFALNNSAPQTQTLHEPRTTDLHHMSYPSHPPPGLHIPAPHHTQSDDTRTTTAFPMDPPPPKSRKRKAATLRMKDWEPHKARIFELHIEQNLPLAEVKRKMEEFHFHAEIRQYRTRITQWGWDKNIKPAEMKAIVRKRQKRQLDEVDKRELTFTVRDNPVEEEKIDRWMKRNGISEFAANPFSPAASTPSAVRCRTMSDRGSPAPGSTYSAQSPYLSRAGTMSVAQSPAPFSPALSISSIVRPQSSSFTGRSPAPIFRSLPSTLSSSVPAPNAFSRLFTPLNSSIPEYAPPSQIDPVESTDGPYRYRQEDEERLRAELSWAETQFGTNHTKTLSILQDLGDVLIGQGRFKTAEEVARRLVERRRDANSEDDGNTVEALCLLGQVLSRQGHHEKGEKLFRRALVIGESFLGEDHLVTLIAACLLGECLNKQGSYEEAESTLRRALEGMKKQFGPVHRNTLICDSALGVTLISREMFQEAEIILRQTLEGIEVALGLEHPLTLGIVHNLGFLFQRQSRYGEVEAMHQRALKGREKVLGPEHPDTLYSMHNLAITWKDQGRIAEALSLMEKCVPLSSQVLGVQHPSTALTRAFLNDLQLEKRNTGFNGSFVL